MLVGTGPLTLDLPAAQLLAVHRQPAVPAVADVAAAVRNALENPIGFPALRRAITPDDHICVVVDEHLADLPTLLTPVLEHLAEARIAPEAITLLCSGNAVEHKLVEQLPAAFAKVKVENHDPHNRKKLSYLAATKQGRRIYLNRTTVDADQLVVLSRRCFDPLLGIGGGEGALFPALGDIEAQRAALAKLSMAAPGKTAWPLQQEAAEVAWLLGAPFFVQILQGPGDEVAHVLGGLVDSCATGKQLLRELWQVEVDQAAEVVIAEVGGDPARHTFAGLASALACASRVVAPGGRIILLSGGAPELGPGARLLRQADTADDALALLHEHLPVDLPAAFQWASSAKRAGVYLLSSLPGDVVEEMFAVPLQNVGQVTRLVGDQRCLYLTNADKTLALVRK